ncbi:uncharacterized protein LODBEIA_P13300 [Lodderomyces beijingensis]|uniref:Zn(2)-C6 fungal-type domain-containing protein n=1 Tax=Lodderomyces beijingensis TaxID=1775926 RepID=A0ABP0ZFZ8_9ASCO
MSSTPNSPKQDKVARQKTFTGCYTCRARKIRCDLARPHCQKCLKAKLTCEGYDIRLRWSTPIRFNPTKNGDVKSTKVNFGNVEGLIIESEENLKDGSPPPLGQEYFHRRLVPFVEWEVPYDTYEDMDSDLGYLQSNSNDSDVSEEGLTKLKGPFGVFLGSKRRSKPKRDARKKTQKTGKQAMSPKKKAKTKTKTKLPNRDDAFTPASGNSSTTATPQSIVMNKEEQGQDRDQNQSLLSNDAMTSTVTSTHDQFWISSELKDAAMISAAALDTQYLDMMNVPLTNDTTSYDGVFTFNNPDLFNLVFHNRPQPFTTMSPQNDVSANMSMSNLLNHQHADTNVPTYYSNFSNFFYNNPYNDNKNLEIELHVQSTSADDTEFIDGDRSNDSKLLAAILKTVQSPLNVNFELSVPKSQSHFGIPTTALQVQPLTRYLLNYYVTEVADLMTVIPLTENPWKAIYFPRALMAIGELSALGKTTTAKNALLNALLAVSAFNLQSKFPKNSESKRFYLNLGIALRNQASLFVKQLLNSKGSNLQAGIEHCVTHEKYKDVLCAVMTMISVDLVWGTMQDTGLYISWCGRVIVAKMATKKKLSPKARILHRIFSSLKLIQDSTSLKYETIRSDFESSLATVGGYDVNGDKFGKSRTERNNKGRIDFIVNNSFSIQRVANTTSPKFVNKKLINTKKNDENFATDALYGLPNSLILLFSDTVELLRVKIYHDHSRKNFPSDFDAKVQELEQSLSNWTLDWELFKGQDLNSTSGRTSTKTTDGDHVEASVDGDVDVDSATPKPPTGGANNTHQTLKMDPEREGKKFFYSSMHEATYHHIMSFYHALVIYFQRFVKQISPTQLQAEVGQTLEHLDAIQNLIAQDRANIIPLFWQGFIAGCEAISKDLQMGFKKWGADIAQYLGSYWGARQIMLEVWRRKRMHEARDDWVSVVQDWEMNLMLN